MRGTWATALAGVLGLSGTVSAGASRSVLPPEARGFNERGVALIVAGEQERGVEALLRAYALMPDALVYRAGRGKVLGAIRGALNQLYASSGEARHLCRSRELQERHLRELRAALGEALKEEDVAGSERVLAETRAALARHGAGDPCAAGEVEQPGVEDVATPTEGAGQGQAGPGVQEPVREAPPLHSRRVPHRGLLTGGGVGIAVGLAALGVMSYGLVVATRMRVEIERRTASEPVRGSEADAEIMRLYHRGYEHRTLALITGVIGGLGVITGAVLVGRYHRSLRRGVGRFGPGFGPGYVGVSARLRF